MRRTIHDDFDLPSNIVVEKIGLSRLTGCILVALSTIVLQSSWAGGQPRPNVM